MKKQTDAMLISYNLTSQVQIKKKSSTVIDNVCVDTHQFNNYTTDPMINALSNHDAQLLTENKINLQNQNYHIKTIRNINKNSIIEFQINLSYSTWDDVFLALTMIRMLILCSIHCLIPKTILLQFSYQQKLIELIINCS